MKSLFVIVVILLVVSPVHAEEGFIPRWHYTIEKGVSSVAAIDTDGDGKLDDVIAGSLDNWIYVFDHDGDLEYGYEAKSSISAVSVFDYYSANGMEYGIAGTWDDMVYVFKKPTGTKTTKLDMYAKWKKNVGDNVLAVAAVDFDSDGYLDDIAVGTGYYADEPYGYVYAFKSISLTGNMSWNYSTSDAISSIAAVDFDSDAKLDDIVVGAGKEVHAINSNGNKTWGTPYTTENDISSVSAADFDRDEELDDVIVGAGNTVYAIDSHKKLLWSYNISANITSIYPIDFDNDDIFDYYLIGADTTVYALLNSDFGGRVLWSYNTSRYINSISAVDLDSDGALDDLIVGASDGVYVYDYATVYLPRLSISKSASIYNQSEGNNITIALKLENNGTGKANNIRLRDKMPQGLTLVKGETSWEGDINSWAVEEIYYVLNAAMAGNYTLPGVEIEYVDNYGNVYKITGDNLSIEVGAKLEEVVETVTTKTAALPRLTVTRSVSMQNLTVGENTTVDILLKNIGDAPAFNVTLDDVPPDGLEVVDGNVSWDGGLEPGKSKVVSYEIEAMEFEGKQITYTLPELAVIYKDSSGQVLEAKGPPVQIVVTVKKQNWIKKILPVLTIIMVGGVFLLRKVKKPRRKKREAQAEVKKGFVKVYREYLKRGEQPTYGHMQKELGISVKETDKIIKWVKKELK